MKPEAIPEPPPHPVTVPTSAGVVVVRHSQGSWRVLLLRSYNYWDCPKGLIEPGEAPIEAARREALEEAGIDDLVFEWGDLYFDTEPYGRERKVSRYYLARSHTEKIQLGVNRELGKPEHQEGRWLRFEDAKSYAVPRIALVLSWARAVISFSETQPGA
jgi:8-oxo-dGTP pyrophosphatase MutT (NUDIX family)